METDDTLNDLADAWRQEPAPAVADLRRRLRRAALLNRLALLLEVVVAVGGFAAGAWLILGGRWTVGLAACLFGGFGLAVSVATRTGTRDLNTHTVADAVQAAIDQTRRQRRVALGGLWMGVAALLFAAAVGLSSSYDSPSREALTRLVRLQSGAGLMVAAALLFVGVSLVRASRRRASLERLRQRLGLPGGEGPDQVRNPREG